MTKKEILDEISINGFIWDDPPWDDDKTNNLISLCEEDIIQSLHDATGKYTMNDDYAYVLKGNPDNVGWFWAEDNYAFLKKGVFYV